MAHDEAIWPGKPKKTRYDRHVVGSLVSILHLADQDYLLHFSKDTRVVLWMN